MTARLHHPRGEPPRAASRTRRCAAGAGAARPAASASSRGSTTPRAERRGAARARARRAPPDVRLACQSRPRGDVVVRPLLPPTARAASGLRAPVARRPGAGDRDAVRRSARVHRPGRAPAALRRRLLPQPLLRGRGRADRGRGGHHQPVHGRRRDGAVRGRADPARGCRRRCSAPARWSRAGRAQPPRWPRPERAAPHRHRHPHGPAVVGEMGYGGTVYLTAVGERSTSRAGFRT